jgi:hypothetical protein
MYTSFQRIIIVGQANYRAQWQSKFARKLNFTPTQNLTDAYLHGHQLTLERFFLAELFHRMSSFSNFCQTIAISLHLDLSAILGGLGLNLNLFLNIGINLDGLLGGPHGGLLSNLLN